MMVYFGTLKFLIQQFQTDYLTFRKQDKLSDSDNISKLSSNIGNIWQNQQC